MTQAMRDDGTARVPDDRRGPPRRALLLINRRGTRSRSQLQEGLHVLQAAGIEARPEEPDEPDRIPELIRRRAADCDLVILGGGDGTFSHALDALLEVDRPLGILPMGNANDLARTLGIPADVTTACRIIADAHTRRIDVGCIESPGAAPTHFFNVASIGLSVRIARRLTRDRKQRWGVLAYLACAWEAVHKQRSFIARITCDGRAAELRSMQVAVGNGRYYGGGMTIVDDAAIDDGRLDLYALPRLPGWRLLVLLPILRWGWHRPIDNILSLHGREIAVDTGRPLPVNVDGEVRASTPAVLRVIPGAIRMFAPPVAATPGRER
ncbi:MAG TPA: lipid kinase [Rhodospirillales bacterium]|nr:lipid kinase [Rhodospirillales bacterium]